jgi:hypothetical protein
MMFGGAYLQGPSAYFQIWKVRLCQMKNSIKIGKKSGKKRGNGAPVGDDVWGWLFSGSSVYFQIWKVRLCHIKNSNKNREKKKQKTKTKKEW